MKDNLIKLFGGLFALLVAAIGSDWAIPFLIGPDVTYTMSPKIKLSSGFAQSVTINNEGGRNAQNVLITMFSGTQNVLDVQLDDSRYQDTTIERNPDRFVVRIGVMPVDSSGSISFVTKNDAEDPVISITYGDRTAQERGPQETVWYRLWLEKLGLAFIVFSILTLINYALRKEQQRRKRNAPPPVTST